MNPKPKSALSLLSCFRRAFFPQQEEKQLTKEIVTRAAKEDVKTLSIPFMSLATGRATDSKLHKNGSQACAALVPSLKQVHAAKAVTLPGTAGEGWDRRVSPCGTSWSAYRERGAQFLSNPTPGPIPPFPSPPPIPGYPDAHLCSLACGIAPLCL